MKIVINRCYGGYSLSKEAQAFLGVDSAYAFDDDRANPKLVECVETLGSVLASNGLASLKVVEIPDDVEWEIENYDGVECVSEKHRRWS